jgi:GDSL-like Lipase/Acylhydrolase family
MRKVRLLPTVGLLFVTGTLAVNFAAGADVVTIGDSLTAEYDTIPDVPGFPTEATAYAEVTVPGWESMSWVEVLGRLRPDDFNFGSYRKLSHSWLVPRLSGYELNWAIPGVLAGQYEDLMTATPRSNPGYLALRLPMDDQLRNRAERVVIWLGGNDFRANYGSLYDGNSADTLIDGLIDDLGRIIDAVQRRNPQLQIVLGNLPDLGATPSTQEAHPDPAKRALVTAATEAANVRIAELAAAKRVVVADVYADTAKLVQQVPIYFGAVQMIDGNDADNEPHHLFTREGLHPNTPLQIRVARTITRAFNQGYGAGLPQITDSEALTLLGINPNEPYLQWFASYGGTMKGFFKDPDADSLNNLVEYAFGLNPTVADADQLPVTLGGPVPGFDGAVSVVYTPDPARVRHIQVKAQYSTDGVNWLNVPAENVVANVDGSCTAVAPASSGTVSLRLKVILRPPSGSSATVMSVVAVE